jgi:succinoglycan biosynthesis protein ExoA
MTAVRQRPENLAQPTTLRLTRPLPCISVVVPVRNEAACIRRTLEQLLAQRYDPRRFEVLVADGCSTDGTPEIVRALAQTSPQIRLLDNPGRLSSAGRNRAIRCSQGDIILVVDGHCDLANPDYLQDLVEAFERSGADCVGRPQPLEVSGASTLQRAIAAARSSRLGHQPASHIYSDAEGFVPPQSVAIAYRREVFERIGLFDERFDACEDVELNHRVATAGLRCFFTPKVAVHYHPRSSLFGLFRQMARYGRGRMRLLRKHPETFSLGVFVPAAFVLGLLVGPLLAHVSFWLVAAYLAVLCTYGALLGAGCLAIAREATDWRVVPWLPLVFVAIHVGAGWGTLGEAVAGLCRKETENRISRLEPRRSSGSGDQPLTAA